MTIGGARQGESGVKEAGRRQRPARCRRGRETGEPTNETDGAGSDQRQISSEGRCRGGETAVDSLCSGVDECVSVCVGAS